MRLVVLLSAGVLAVSSLSGCSGSKSDDVNGDAPPSVGPAVAQVTPTPTKPPKTPKTPKTPKSERKADPTLTPQPVLAPTPPAEPTLPPGEEFDPEHYDPEGDRAPGADSPAASPAP